MKIVGVSLVLVPCLGVSVALAEVPPPAAPAGPPAGVPAPPAVAPAETLQAHRLAGAIRIDGRLEEDAWREAAATGRFVQEAPHHGQDATSPTEVRDLYDDRRGVGEPS